MTINEIRAGAKVAKGEWSVADLIEAVRSGEVVVPPPEPKTEDPDWDTIEAEAKPPPFYSLRMGKKVTPEEYDELRAAIDEQRQAAT